MGTTKQRKERLQHIIEVLKAAPGQKLDFKDLYSPLVLDWGITKNTMINYLTSLQDADLVCNDFKGKWLIPMTRFDWDTVYLVGGEGYRRRFNPSPEEKAHDEAEKEAFLSRTYS